MNYEENIPEQGIVQENYEDYEPNFTGNVY